MNNLTRPHGGEFLEGSNQTEPDKNSKSTSASSYTKGYSRNSPMKSELEQIENVNGEEKKLRQNLDLDRSEVF